MTDASALVFGILIGIVLGAVIACATLLSHILRWSRDRDDARRELRWARGQLPQVEAQLNQTIQYAGRKDVW